MQKSNIYAPSIWLAPATRKKVNQGRLYTDIVGLWIINTFGSLFPASIHWIVSIYSIMAWVTILTIDPSRLPDAATTKLNQRKAWGYLGRFLPLYSVVFIALLFGFKIPVGMGIHFISIGAAIGLIVNGCMIELFYRNIFQAKLRQLGLSVSASICLQSICFAVPFYLGSHSLYILAGTVMIGIVNGFIVYKTRSIYPNFLITIFWLYLFS